LDHSAFAFDRGDYSVRRVAISDAAAKVTLSNPYIPNYVTAERRGDEGRS
jgi:hypothetical protein